jgi:exodeoxyribonuclease VII small subunit
MTKSKGPRMTKTFEESFGELSSIVERLQAGELPLEETISLFEQGMRLSFECERFLDEAGRRVEVLVEREDGRLETEEFDEDD